MAALFGTMLLAACTHSIIAVAPQAPGAMRPTRTFDYPVGEYFDPSVTWISGSATFTTDACGLHQFPYSAGSGVADLLKQIDRASFSRVASLAGPAQKVEGVRRNIIFEAASMQVSLGSDRVSWGTARRTVEARLQIRVGLSIDGRPQPLGTISGYGAAQELGSVFAGCGAIADLIPTAIDRSIRAAAADYMARIADAGRF